MFLARWAVTGHRMRLPKSLLARLFIILEESNINFKCLTLVA